MGLYCSNANKDYKGSPARGRRKIQTRCHLRGNFPCLGRSERRRKAPSPWLTQQRGCLGCEEQPPGRTGPVGGSPRKPSPSVSSTKDHAGGRAGGQHPPHRLPESNLVAGGGRCEKQPPDLAPAPRSGVSIPLQARGHRRSRTPWAQCSSADPT